MVAAARAIAGRAEHPLIDDPFAEPLVRAVGVDLLTRLATGDVIPGDIGDDASGGMQRMADNMAVRTMFFDDFFLDAADADIKQAVILASGLDSRPYRLAWAPGTTVYEVDQPDVIAFKTRTLAELGAEPAARRRTVAVDLRDDWPTALKEAGFDPSVPTAWSAEGLLGYLPPDAQDRLLDTITALSAPGSRFATESTPTLDEADHGVIREQMQKSADQWRKHGFELDLAELIYLGDRNEAEAYLTNHGWQMTGSTVRELFDAHGLPPFDDEEMAGYADTRYVAGTLGDAR
ncbi:MULTISPECIES: class I SAM-dependent methyltransferase [unclassified Mycobacterium]|uniref:class I SAM-dependent methyltransferase n=1 Tax=unclassified Mycobacterium TaxID=2642494 RepID=UPI0029C8F2B5|nr:MULTISPECIES: class I SAM-dependent methyltransferase [unclassified Mycobacterium]